MSVTAARVKEVEQEATLDETVVVVGEVGQGVTMNEKGHGARLDETFD